MLSTRRKLLFSGVVILLVSCVCLLCGGLMLRLLLPQPYMAPRWQFSKGYGWMLFPSRTMIHAWPYVSVVPENDSELTCPSYRAANDLSC